MNIITKNPAQPADYSAGRIGFWKRLARSLTAGQEARAKRIVQRHLANYSDQDLHRYGYTAVEIAEIRKLEWPNTSGGI